MYPHDRAALLRDLVIDGGVFSMKAPAERSIVAAAV